MIQSRATIILAAGKGKRMNSDLAKVLHPIAGRPLIDHVCSALRGLGLQRTIVVIGQQGEAVESYLSGKFPELNLSFVWQKEQLGTGHAVMQAEDAMRGFNGTVVVTAGDVPLVTNSTLRALFERHERSSASVTCLSAEFPDPTGYGRILREGKSDKLGRIVEHKDAPEEIRAIREINSGIFAFDSTELFSALSEIGCDNTQGEYYLTDVVEVLNRRGRPCRVLRAENSDEVRGVNSIEQLKELEALFGGRPAGLARATDGAQARVR